MTSAYTSSDAHRMMLFDANKKSVGVAYLLWIFAGMFGGHRFYTGRIGSAVIILVLTLISFAALPVLIIPAVWVLVDAFLIPDWIRSYNTALVSRLTGEPS